MDEERNLEYYEKVEKAITELYHQENIKTSYMMTLFSRYKGIITNEIFEKEQDRSVNMKNKLTDWMEIIERAVTCLNTDKYPLTEEEKERLNEVIEWYEDPLYEIKID